MELVRRPYARTLEFGIYRDGDNNLDSSQSAVLDQARRVSAADRAIQFTVEDATHDGLGGLVTDHWTIQNGKDSVCRDDRRPEDMASPHSLAELVARTLDNAEKSGAKQTWIELVDHGAGDGGGLQSDTFKKIMPMPQIAEAIARGIELHAQRHPEDAGRTVDGVVANQCLMASLGFADALSHAGVRFLAASPETMISPGVPTEVAAAVANHVDDPRAMAQSVVAAVMRDPCQPAAAFDVFDLAPSKMRTIESAVKACNDAIVAVKGDRVQIAALREDAAAVLGMVRFPQATPDMPWHADRPALELYRTIASDGRLDSELRGAAARAEHAVNALVLAHAETSRFAPFGGADYSDATGPTVHFPVKPAQIDPWAPRVTETHNRFFSETDAAAAERAIA